MPHGRRRSPRGARAAGRAARGSRIRPYDTEQVGAHGNGVLAGLEALLELRFDLVPARFTGRVGGEHAVAHLVEVGEREAALVLDRSDVLEALRFGHRPLGGRAHLGLVVDGPHQLEVLALRQRFDDEDAVADDAVQLGERGVRVGDVVQALEQHGDVDAAVWQRDLLRAALQVAPLGVDLVGAGDVDVHADRGGACRPQLAHVRAVAAADVKHGAALQRDGLGQCVEVVHGLAAYAARVQPLADVRILAIEQFGAGPWGTLQLSDLGAEVIKIEDPGSGGDVARTVPPFREGEDSLYFEAFNRGKRSISLDLR